MKLLPKSQMWVLPITHAGSWMAMKLDKDISSYSFKKVLLLLRRLLYMMKKIFGTVISALAEQKMPLLDNELLWAVRDHWQQRFLEKQPKNELSSDKYFLSSFDFLFTFASAEKKKTEKLWVISTACQKRNIFLRWPTCLILKLFFSTNCC